MQQLDLQRQGQERKTNWQLTTKLDYKPTSFNFEIQIQRNIQTQIQRNIQTQIKRNKLANRLDYIPIVFKAI